MTHQPAPPASGGRYTEDPKTGQRTRVAASRPEAAAAPPDAVESIQAPPPADATQRPARPKGAKS